MSHKVLLVRKNNPEAAELLQNERIIGVDKSIRIRRCTHTACDDEGVGEGLDARGVLVGDVGPRVHGWAGHQVLAVNTAVLLMPNPVP